MILWHSTENVYEGGIFSQFFFLFFFSLGLSHSQWLRRKKERVWAVKEGATKIAEWQVTKVRNGEGEKFGRF